MVDLMGLVQARRSIRKYEERPVAESDLRQILEAVRWAPSWANTQCWEVVVVKDPGIKSQLQDTVPAKANPGYNAVGQAPVVLVMCARSNVSGYYKGAASTHFGDWMMYDLGLATQNLCLMAHQLGLGTVIMGVFDHARARDILAVPQDFEPVTLIPLGYPAKAAGAPKRREISEFTHNDRW